MALEIGDKVRWQVGGRICEGEVRDIYLRDQRSNSPLQVGQGRALLIELSDGKKVLKLENELAPIARKRFG
jgi:hypothetical protein